MPRILLLYATRYSGHHKAAEAIIKSLYNISHNVETASIDFFTYHYPILSKFISRIYLELIRSIPQAWDYLYSNPDIAKITKEIRKLFTLLNIPKLYEDIKKYKPDAIVCTQAIPAGFIASEKQAKRLTLPLIASITDFVVNPYWPHENIERYFVPDESTASVFIKKGVDASSIFQTGIPIDESFANKIPPEVARKKLNLNPDLVTILLMGGNQGLGPISEAVGEIINLKKNIQIIVITGYNRLLYRYLKRTYSENKRIKILSYTKNVSQIMDAATLIITKPGGITSSESLSKGLPMIITSPLPGQEEKNANYLTKHQVAIRCDNINELSSIVNYLINHPQKLKKMSNKSLSIAKPFASIDIANKILEFLND